MKEGPSGPSLGAGYLVLMIPLAASATGLAIIGFAVISAIVMLIALFLPLAAWIIASRRGEWEQLLAATFVTVALALPVLVIAALVEVYVSPHLFVALTHIRPPIVRHWEGWIVTIH